MRQFFQFPMYLHFDGDFPFHDIAVIEVQAIQGNHFVLTAATTPEDSVRFFDTAESFTLIFV